MSKTYCVYSLEHAISIFEGFQCVKRNFNLKGKVCKTCAFFYVLEQIYILQVNHEHAFRTFELRYGALTFASVDMFLEYISAIFLLILSSPHEVNNKFSSANAVSMDEIC